MASPDLVLQTIYAELLERAQTAAFAEAFPEDGAFTSKIVGPARYWYFQTQGQHGRVQRYAGRETPELLDRIARHKEARHDEQERRALASRLVRAFGLPRPLPQAGELLAVLAKAGVFRLRAVLVGTVAYQTYSAMLGTRLPLATLQTGDIDIAQYKNVSVAVADSTPPMLDLLKQADPTFRPVPGAGGHRQTVSYAAKNGLRVDFLTPNTGAETDRPQALPALRTDAQPLRFLDYLIHEPHPAVLLHGPGVYLHVPAPERFAVHKLIVSTRRHSAKSDKDIGQADALIDALSKNRALELRAAWDDAYGRGEKWRSSMLEGASRLTAESRDGLLKILKWSRAKIPGLELTFSNPRPRYDFDRKSVVFTGKDFGGEMRCIISGETLRDHFNVQGSNPRDYVARYDDHRSLFEDLARAKYRTWPIEEAGVVLLGTAEIPRLLHEVGQSLPSLTRP